MTHQDEVITEDTTVSDNDASILERIPRYGYDLLFRFFVIVTFTRTA